MGADPGGPGFGVCRCCRGGSIPPRADFRPQGRIPTMGWQDFGDGGEEQTNDRSAITFGDLRDGEGVQVTVVEEPETFESDQYGEGVRIPCTFHSSDYAFRHQEDDEQSGAMEDGDDVVIITWSKRMVAAISNYADDAGGIVGERIEITKFTEGGRYDTQYRVEQA